MTDPFDWDENVFQWYLIHIIKTTKGKITNISHDFEKFNVDFLKNYWSDLEESFTINAAMDNNLNYQNNQKWTQYTLLDNIKKFNVDFLEN